MRFGRHTKNEIEYLKNNGLEKTIEFIEFNYDEKIKEIESQKEVDIIRAKELNERINGK